MVVNYVKNHGDTKAMSGVDQFFEAFGTTVGTFDGKNIGWVVTPGKTTGKFRWRHNLNGIDAELSQIGKLFNRLIQIPRRPSRLIVEGADVHFVNDHFIPWRCSIGLIAPLEAGINNDGVTRRAGHILRIRIDAPKFICAVKDNVLVLIALPSARDISRPITISFRNKGMAGI